jgi:hypothetical protein
MNMTDGQHLNIAMISASVLLVILQLLKRWLLRNEPLGEHYDDIDRVLGRQFSTHQFVEPPLKARENSSGLGKRH